MFSELSISVEGGEGVLLFSPDGSELLYTPPLDFTGEDMFTVTVADKFSSSAPVELRIRVGETAISAPPSESAASSEESGSAALIAGAAAAVAAAAVAIWLVNRKKNGQ